MKQNTYRFFGAFILAAFKKKERLLKKCTFTSIDTSHRVEFVTRKVQPFYFFEAQNWVQRKKTFYAKWTKI